MTNPYGGPVPVLGIKKTLKPQILKMQGEMDFDDYNIVENLKLADACEKQIKVLCCDQYFNSKCNK